MMRRRPSPYFASLLLVLQLLMAPFTHAEVIPGGDVDCASLSHDGAMNMDAEDCAHMAADKQPGCQQDGHHCLSHAACSCACAHTPALETVRSLVLDPGPPIAAESVVVMPALERPPFKLLRPPK